MRMVVMVLLALSTASQSFDQYSGQWTAQYRGTTYVRIVLRESGGAPQGAMAIGGDIHLDARGDVDGAAEAPATPTPMRDVHWNGTVLAFSIADGDEVHKFELRLIDANTGELSPIIPPEQRQELADAGIPLPKPFPVTKGR